MLYRSDNMHLVQLQHEIKMVTNVQKQASDERLVLENALKELILKRSDLASKYSTLAAEMQCISIDNYRLTLQVATLNEELNRAEQKSKICQLETEAAREKATKAQMAEACSAAIAEDLSRQWRNCEMRLA